MIEQDTTVIEELLLHDEDFPDDYVHMAHPGDYIGVQDFKPQFIIHSHFGRHNRLIARVAWKTDNGTMIPMSFVCDTGAPSHIYLSTKALRMLNDNDLVLKDEKDTAYVKIHTDSNNTFPATIEETPHVHKDANILGLKSLKKLHLHLAGEEFSFNENFVYM